MRKTVLHGTKAIILLSFLLLFGLFFLSGCEITDDDGDGVINTEDLCDNTPTGAEVDEYGCTDSQADPDNDGVHIRLDQCPDTSLDESADQSDGCSDSQKDSDNDGINDLDDICPDTLDIATADTRGCSDSQKDTDWAMVATESFHTLAIKEDGRLFAWGNNNYGQLGIEGITSANSPIQVGTDSDWVYVEAGPRNSFAIKEDGSLYAWGLNSKGQLGDGTIEAKTIPTRIGDDNDWACITSGTKNAYYTSFGYPDFTLGIKTDGTLYAWGLNNYGQLGDGTTEDKLVPTQIGSDTDWQKVSAGGFHSVALKSDGTLHAWGANNYGQLGDGTKVNRSEPTLIPLTSGTWSSVDAAEDHTVAVSGGYLYGWGHNEFGQIGLNSGSEVSITSPTLIGSDGDWDFAETGYGHTLASKFDGSLYSLGLNDFGQIGDGTTSNKRTPTFVTTGIRRFTICAGGNMSIAITMDNSLLAWGWNRYGQLGDGSGQFIDQPIRIGHDYNWQTVDGGSVHSLGLKTNGELYGWGSNNSYQLNSSRIDSHQPIQIGLDSDWATVSAGGNYSLAVKHDRTLYQWGRLSNFSSYIRDPSQISTEDNWDIISVGDEHALATKTNGTLYSWGHNAYGKLGNGLDTSDSGASYYTPVMIETLSNCKFIIAGEESSTAITEGGSLYSWGSYIDSALYSYNPYYKVPTLQTAYTDWESMAMGGNSPNSTFVIGLREPQIFMAWGGNGSGQLGIGSTESTSDPTQVGYDMDWSGCSAGDGHVIALKDDGSIYGWGANQYGQLGDGTYTGKTFPTQLASNDDWTFVSAGNNYTLAIKDNGTLYGWGDNLNGQLGTPTVYKPVPVLVNAN